MQSKLLIGERELIKILASTAKRSGLYQREIDRVLKVRQGRIESVGDTVSVRVGRLRCHVARAEVLERLNEVEEQLKK